MDPLSDVLAVLNPSGYAAAGFDFGGDWSVRFPPQSGLKCFALVSGQGWLSMEGLSTPVLAAAGDCLLLPHGRSFQVASDLALAPISAETLYTASPEAAMSTLNGGGDATGFAAHFDLAGPQADFLLESLPPVMHLRKESQRATLRWCLMRMMQELLEPEPGGAMVLQQLARMVLVDALRQHLAQGIRGGTGWLFALADKQMAVAIKAMHDAPAQAWTLQSLSQRVGMSRTSFAMRFKQTVGRSPMGYLTRWRMLLAADRLKTSTAPVAAVALALGYESESAFSTAFKRVMGCSPRQYGKASASA